MVRASCRAFLSIRVAICLWVAMSPCIAHSSPLDSQVDEAGGITIPWNHWELIKKSDPIDGRSSVTLNLLEHADSNGRRGQFEVTTTCDQKTVSLRVVYISLFEKNMHFKVSDPFGRIAARMNVDGKLRIAQSNPSEYRNLVVFDLIDAPEDPFLKRTGILGPYKEAVRQEILDAKEVRMEFVLDNGDTPLLTIHPQDKAFHDFVSQEDCRDPNPPKRTDPSVMAAEERRELEIRRGQEWEAIQKDHSLAAVVTVVGQPSDTTVSEGWVWLGEDDVQTALLRQGIDVPENEDPLLYARRTCHSSVSECKKFFAAGQASNSLNPSGRTKLRGVPPGTYHLMAIALGTHTGYFEDQVVNIKMGQNEIPFPALH
jgi:hypothetical protein